jgi:hypothetical protein
MGTVLWAGAAVAAPPVPSGPHPRLFLDDPTLAAFKSNASVKGTTAQSLVSQCQDTIDNPQYNAARGGVDGDVWPGGAMRCAFAYLATGNAAYLTQAIMFWHASLNDDQMIGDNLGCIAGVDTDWRNHWDGSYPPPPVLVTVTHDTGYPMRWYGPYLSLAYDWLYAAPGVDDALRAQTRTCLTAWMDWYTDRGYLNDQPGANYEAGFVAAKTFAAVAIGNDGGADGHLWAETVDGTFTKILIGQGLAGSNQSALGTSFGPLVGGDWGSWEYGPLSVAEYSASTLLVEKSGAPLPAMDEWLNSLAIRYVYATVPTGDAQYCGCGDCGDGSTDVNAAPNANVLDAVLLGPSSDAAASWALFMKQKQKPSGGMIYNALGEARSVTPADYTATAGVPLWYLSHGSRTMYARSSWQKDALWSVFASPPAILDHQHFSASSFIFSRGADHLIVDPAPYGGVASFESNAVTADSQVVVGDYAPSQTPWSTADLAWARGTDDAVYAARSDFAGAFIFNGTPSDIPYAHREWVMLPEGEVVTVDRVHTSDASRNMYVSFHTNTGGGGLTLGADGVATGTVGGSQVAIHPVVLSGGMPRITQPPVGDCYTGCNYPCGTCEATRFQTDKYMVTVPGTWAVAVHVIDALGTGEAAADVGSLNDDVYDPAPKQNGAVLGAAVFRGSKQTYVVASSATDGASPPAMTYGVPGSSAGRHIVFDAPEAADGTSSVTAAAQAGRCVVNVQAGSGHGIAGHPLMFVVGSVTGGCTVTESTGVDPGQPIAGGGADAGAGADAGPLPEGGAGRDGGAGAAGSGSDGGAGGSGQGNSARFPGFGGSPSGCGCTQGGDRSELEGVASLLAGLALIALRRVNPSRRRRTTRATRHP